MNCVSCPHYHCGKGSKQCLKCDKYKHFQVKHTPRPQINIEILPDAILESIADNKTKIDIINAIRKLPLQYSAPLILKYILNISNEETAKYLKISLSNLHKKNKFSINKIRELINN